MSGGLSIRRPTSLACTSRTDISLSPLTHSCYLILLVINSSSPRSLPFLSAPLAVSRTMAMQPTSPCTTGAYSARQSISSGSRSASTGRPRRRPGCVLSLASLRTGAAVTRHNEVDACLVFLDPPLPLFTMPPLPRTQELIVPCTLFLAEFHISPTYTSNRTRTPATEWRGMAEMWSTSEESRQGCVSALVLTLRHPYGSLSSLVLSLLSRARCSFFSLYGTLSPTRIPSPSLFLALQHRIRPHASTYTSSLPRTQLIQRVQGPLAFSYFPSSTLLTLYVALGSCFPFLYLLMIDISPRTTA